MYDDVSILKRKYLKEDKQMSNDDYYYQAKELIGKYEMVEDEDYIEDWFECKTCKQRRNK